MTARIIDGRAYATDLKREVGAELAQLAQEGVQPGLATMMVGEDYAAAAYERRVRRIATELGCRYTREHLPADAEEADVVACVGKLAADPRVSGILVLRPLPPWVSEPVVYRALDPLKDIEAVHPVNAGLLALGRPRYIPSTPASVFHMLDRHLRESGCDPQEVYTRSNMLLIGRSNNVGKPALLLGLAKGATLLSCDVHSFKAGLLYEHTSRADILIVAAGSPGLITGEHLKPGAIVIDVGINPLADSRTGRMRLVGDLDFASATTKAAAVSPVPGGVGPITDVWLLKNTVTAAKLIARIEGGQPAPDGAGPESSGGGNIPP